MQLEAVLWWQNHFGITLSTLHEHRHDVMHICLPDKHNVANHFCLQVFLSEQSFSMSCFSSTVSFVVFQGYVVSCYLKLHYGYWYRLELLSGSFLPVGFVHDIDYFPLQSFNRYLVKRSVQFQISYHWSCQQIFVMCYHFT